VKTIKITELKQTNGCA